MLVGTSAILAADVTFANLGLIVVDEEQLGEAIAKKINTGVSGSGGSGAGGVPNADEMSVDEMGGRSLVLLA